MVYPSEDRQQVHGIDIPIGRRCVSIDGIIQADALFPVQIHGEMVTIRDALGSFLAWPEELISYPTAVVSV